MPNQLAKLAYQKLLVDIADTYEQARVQSIQAVNKITVRAYWEIGKLIIQKEQDNQIRAQYGARLLENLSDDLTAKFGKGFSLSNLQYMRRLYKIYSIPQTSGELEWSHYKLLLSIKEENKRGFYEKQVVERNWSIRQFQKILRHDKIKLTTFRFKRPFQKKDEATPKLNLTRGSLYTYKLIKPKYIVSTDNPLVVDCGFYISRALPLNGLTNPKDKDIVESAKTDKGYKFISSSATKKQLYTYKAFVERVVDADTVWVNIDCGFNTFSRQKLRLRGIDAPELYSKKGQKAKEFVEGALSKVSFIIIKSYSLDKYGRPLSDLFYLEGEPDPQKVLERGTFLNQQLLDLGLAKIVE